MITPVAEIQETLLLLIQSFDQIGALDLEDEEQVEQLEALQLLQEEWKARLDVLGLKDAASNPQIETLLQAAYQSGLEAGAKLEAFKGEISAQFAKLQEGQRMKNAYNQAYNSSEGYFIDDKK
ncbi:hypothetical protein H7C19_12550 [Cohnella nanjingensis]|uniref:Flagellar protein FliT n=2 Tax=Cohnella nanjingensis TaxID=1387779 RepID=A0A7X0VEZ7_9BACL|nr:hypothetical protein [Cohnella nanjingensis]